MAKIGGMLQLFWQIASLAAASVLNFRWEHTRASDFRTSAIPTYLNQVNPSMDRESPIHDAVFSRMDSLGAKLVRYLHWSHSQAPFPELQEGVFNFTLTDQYVEDFMSCANAEESVINFDAAPSWLHEGGDLSRPLRDPTGRELGEWISRIVSWYTKGGFSDARTGKNYTSNFNFRWRNYEVLNEPNLKAYMGTFPQPNRTNSTVCTGGAARCAMVPEPTNSYYKGSYSGRPSIGSAAGCNAACLDDDTCVQTTWAPRHAKTHDGACVLYRSIDSTELVNTTVSDPGVAAFAKCRAGEAVAAHCAAFSPGGGVLAPYAAYTRLYDGIAGVLARDHPELRLHALSLAQTNSLTVSPATPGALAAVYDDRWFSYFFNRTNHETGAPPPSYVTYHFYAFPGHDSDDAAGAMWGPDARWPVQHSKPVALPVSQWPVHLFKQAARFVARAEHVNGLVRAGTFRGPGGADVKISANEVGVIGGSLCPSADLFSTADGRLFWNLKASLWAYYFAELARLGVDAIASSQITGYPPSTWEIHGKPVANNYPCVSMLDWHNGSHTAVSWALQMFIDVLGAGAGGDMMAAMPPHTGERGTGSGAAPYWPLPSVLYSMGFTINRAGGDSKRVILLANTNSSNATATLTGVAGGKLHLVDAAAGHGTTPYSTTELKSGLVALGPLAVALVELPLPPADTIE
eukprot:g7533.t1